ncbi:oxidoreductase [Sporolactobacillus sp. THM7-4]|nr:oxidoreductase [Sporolactobacillus sp. THM7-4]
MTLLTMGIIGFGKSATRYHIPYIKQRKNIWIKKIFDPNLDINKKRKINLTDTVFIDKLDNILEDPDISLITICTPPSTHYELAKKCLKNGKNILVEKPFCVTVQEVNEILTLAKQENLIAMPYQNRRFDSDFLALKEVLKSGQLGRIVEVEFHFDRYRPIDERKKGTIYDGEFYGLGVHLLDKVISVFGIPDKVYYDIRTLRDPEKPDDTFEMQLFFNKMKVIIKVNQLIIGGYPSIRIQGDKGSFIKYEQDQQETCLKKGIMPWEKDFGKEISPGVLNVIQDGKIVSKKIESPVGNYGNVYDSLYKSIIYGEPKLVTDEETRLNIAILEEGIKRETPHVVTFKKP